MCTYYTVCTCSTPFLENRHQSPNHALLHGTCTCMCVYYMYIQCRRAYLNRHWDAWASLTGCRVCIIISSLPVQIVGLGRVRPTVDLATTEIVITGALERRERGQRGGWRVGAATVRGDLTALVEKKNENRERGVCTCVYLLREGMFGG